MSPIGSKLFPPTEQEIFMEDLFQLLLRLQWAKNKLHRVTGKRHFRDIDPMKEKRWPSQCWEAYSIIGRLLWMYETGLHYHEFERRILADIRPVDNWVCNVTTGKFKGFTGKHHSSKRFKGIYP